MEGGGWRVEGGWRERGEEEGEGRRRVERKVGEREELKKKKQTV